MNHFYYVTTINLTNPIVKTMFETSGFSGFVGPMVDFKLRSRLFLDFEDALEGSIDDFNEKLEYIFDDEDEHFIHQFSLNNPNVVNSTEQNIEVMMAKFGQKYLDGWDVNCCCAVFYATIDLDAHEDEVDLHPNAWLIKYEIFFTDVGVEHPGNGDFVFTHSSKNYH